MIVTALPHKLRVMRMYRYGLKELISWSVDRHAWFPRAAALREEFESKRAVTSRSEIVRLVDEGEDLLSRFHHPEPLFRGEFPGGSDYAINPSHPKKIRMIMNWDLLDPYKTGEWM